MTQQVQSPILELQHQQLLLQMEYEEEKKSFQQKVDAIGMQRRIERGDAWWPVHFVRSFYNSLNQFCVEITRTRKDDDEADHNFEFGKPVSFFRESGEFLPCKRPSAERRVESGEFATAIDGNSEQKAKLNSKHSAVANSKLYTLNSQLAKGTVSYADADRMVVALPDDTNVGDLKQEGIGIQLSFDETSYRMMFDALERTIRAKGRLGYLRDLFYTPGMKAETFSFPDIHFPYLNATQEHAVNEVLRAKDVAIVHGPPGTGKTTTLVEAIYETLRRENQVLVCAQSNMAVDWISERLVDRGLNVLRIGNPVRVDDKMLSFTYERRFEAHPDYELLWSLRKAIRELRKNRKRGDDKYHQKLERLKDRATALEIAINQQLFGEARVIACTLVGSGHRLLEGMKFGTVFIDEAAQALEAACWIPIRRASRVIFAGDHCQLPPTVKSYEALKGGLGKTLMERIVEQHPAVVTLLTMQYRMNEEIMRFSSDWFYDNMVQSAPEVKYRSILDLDLPMTWVDSGELRVESLEFATAIDGKSEQRTEMNSEQRAVANSKLSTINSTLGSISNASEARLTLLALRAYYEMIGKERILSERLDVGIISPYRAQVQLLRRMVKKEEFFKPFRSLITINTVDGFQGQERDIIVISLVRSNDEGQIGFLRDLRRMNVAITRARMKLIILGDRSTLCRHPFYRKLWEYIQGLKN
ncbi:AAA domain-containing protein [Prevotella sp. E13-27]|uniref:AAA domain-containing protein n=1 Tax=Prevotella sp. E13-27 TaxID=2938122 RepID=UPI00200AB5FF|nr:AAA domain-containing protein [Prevotella sp. E13-27]MCK8621552.1 AAA domain-containing protein [Prevotella sp. E13-27]